MATKPKYGAYEHNAKTHRKRKGRHCKSASKRIPNKKKYKGQGR